MTSVTKWLKNNLTWLQVPTFKDQMNWSKVLPIMTIFWSGVAYIHQIPIRRDGYVGFASWNPFVLTFVASSVLSRSYSSNAGPKPPSMLFWTLGLLCIKINNICSNTWLQIKIPDFFWSSPPKILLLTVLS